MAPPEKPSPRRFLPASSSRRQPSPTKSAKQPSRLIQSTTATAAAPEEEPVRTNTHAHRLAPPPRPQPHLPPSSGSQFASTPRFPLARPKPVAVAQQQRQDVASPPRSSLAHALRPPRVREDVEDTGSSPSDRESENGNHDDDEEMLLTTEPGEVARPSIEDPRAYSYEHAKHTETNTDFSPSSPKRRRLAEAPDPDLLLSPGHRSRMSKANKTNTTQPAPRFVALSHSANTPDATSTLSTTTAAPSTSRPSFLRPPTPPDAPPLPQAFSPHRRGATFVPGGVASTVQAWVVEAGVQRGVVGLGSRKGAQNYHFPTPPHQQTQSGTWGFRVKVERAEEVVGGSGGWRVWGLRGDGNGSKGQSGERVRCLLVGKGKGSGNGNGNEGGKGVVDVGAVVGVSRGGLGWEVDVGGDGQEGGGGGGSRGEGIWWVGVGWEVNG